MQRHQSMQNSHQTNRPSAPFHSQVRLQQTRCSQFSDASFAASGSVMEESHLQGVPLNYIPNDEFSVVSSFTGASSSSNGARSSVRNEHPSQGSPTVTPPKTQSKGVIPDVAPSSMLHSWLAKAPRRINVARENYVEWAKPGQPHHSPRYSAIFVHPVTKQVFPAGRFGDPNEYQFDDDTVWYATLKMARNGAAARAYDCLLFEKGQELGIQYEPIGDDDPSIQPVPLPASLPADVRSKLASM